VTAATPQPAAVGRSRRRLAAAAGAGALVLLAAAAAWWLWPRDPSPGPLRTRSTDNVAFGVHAGVPFGWGTAVVWNTGDQPAVLDRVSLLDAGSGLHLVRPLIGGADRKFLFFVQAYRWPNPKAFTDLHPVRGMAVPPQATQAGERGVELVFVLRADRPGRYTASRIAIDYHVGATKQRAVVESGLTVCPTTPPAPLNQHCRIART
jgi:hypothetical protein